MGARGIGHICYLTSIAPPRIAVVLNVGLAHVGEFGSVDNIAQAKVGAVEALPADGVAVLNATTPLVRAMAADRTPGCDLGGAGRRPTWRDRSASTPGDVPPSTSDTPGCS